jgi:electron transport complex protein RnfG
MSDTTTRSAPKNHSNKMLLSMTGIGIICALLIVLTYEGTLSRISNLRAEALEQAIFEVLPGTTATQAFEYVNGSFVPSEGKNGQKIFVGYDEQNNMVGVAIEAEGKGYADKIRILYGYDLRKEQIIGFRVLETKETPGLGDKIEKDPIFLSNFKALDVSLNDAGNQLANRVIAVKSGLKENPWEIDGITGATISSRAIGSIIDESTRYWIPAIFGQKETLLSNQKVTKDE